MKPDYRNDEALELEALKKVVSVLLHKINDLNSRVNELEKYYTRLK